MNGYRTLISLAVALLGELLRQAGVELSVEDQAGIVNTVMVVGGILAATYFRFAARRQVGAPEALK